MTRAKTGSPEPAEQLATASTGRRMGAWLADFVLLYILVNVAAIALGQAHWITTTVGSDDASTWMGSTWTGSTFYVDAVWFGLLFALLSACYTIPMWRLAGATLSQRLLRLRVADAREPGLLTWRQAAVRWFALFGWAFAEMASGAYAVLLLAVFGWPIALLISQLRGDRGQGLHDRLAHSLVVAPGRGHYSAWD
jgi:uncharacterized RDD family membrane protein YckC